MVLTKKEVMIQLIVIAACSFIFIITANWISKLAANPGSEYGKAYHEKMQKGFLTEEEITLLKKMETEHIADKSARNERMRGYFGALTLSMLTMSILLFWAKYKMLIQIGTVIISPIIFIVAVIATGSVGQSMFWLIFGLFGILTAEYSSRNKAPSSS